jgi:energy-coupling factor transporter ATP-binding protein EcfA2
MVVEVNGERALVELSADTTRPLVDDYYPGQPGTHVKIPIRDHSVIGIVSSIRMLNGVNGLAGKPGQSPRKNIADCVLLGTLDAKGRFGRGVAVYPNVGQKVEMVGSEELKKVFSDFVDYGYSFGRPVHAEDQRAYVQVDKFFGQHIAVLGTTGCGKSYTVVSMLQHAIKKYPNTHIVVLDLHGEYAAAFPDEVNVIDGENVELPYWLLSFDEFQDLFVDTAEFTAKNQVTVLRDAIIRAKQGAEAMERLGLGSAVTADAPVYYDIDEMLEQIRSWNIQMVYNSNGVLEQGPLYGAFDKFLIRFDSKKTDPRFAFMFQPKRYSDSNSLVTLLREYLSIQTGKRMTVVDLSGVPSEAVSAMVAVVCRVVFEFNLWNPERTHFPILLVLEEAHNYVPIHEVGRYTSARIAVERVLKEGRKYGTGTIIVSQRPKELSETVLSQCNTFVAMRLTNPDDQAYIRKLVPDSLSGLMAMLPALRTGEALILGDAVAMPTRVLIDMPNPRPMSSDVEYARWW